MSHNVNPSSFDFRPVTTVPSILIPQNPHRRGIMISSPVVNRVTISPRSAVSDAAGIVLFPGNSPTVLCCCDVGDWLRLDLFAVTNAGSETIGYSEVTEEWQQE